MGSYVARRASQNVDCIVCGRRGQIAPMLMAWRPVKMSLLSKVGDTGGRTGRGL